MSDNQYKIDRNYVTAMSFEEADDHTTYWLNKTEDERLNAQVFFLTNYMA